MNAKKAKKIRQIIYGKDDYKEREYGMVLKKEIPIPYKDEKGNDIVLKRYQWVNVGQLEKMGKKEISKRRIYQYTKKAMKKTKIKDLEKEILN